MVENRTPSSRRATVARLFVFTLCVSAIVALAVNSRRESPSKLPTDPSVASSSLPVQTEDGVSVGKTADFDDVSTIETSEADALVLDETPTDVEIEAPGVALCAS